MGLLSKLKNAVTGGGASVTVSVEDPKIGADFPVTVTAQIADGDVKINKVYVQLVGREEVRVPSVKKAERRGEELVEVEGEATHSEKTFETEITLSGAETLEANSSQEWTGTLSIPSGQMPTYMGRNAKQQWSVFAGLDCFGNDPDSGWQTIVVKEQSVE